VGKGKVTVPASCWKVVVAVPDSGGDDVSKITADARVIAIDMANDNSAVGDPWAGYRVTPADIEAKTGYQFFDSLPTEVADSLRRKLDTTYVPPPKPLTHNRE
jgi:endonuclease G